MGQQKEASDGVNLLNNVETESTNDKGVGATQNVSVLLAALTPSASAQISSESTQEIRSNFGEHRQGQTQTTMTMMASRTTELQTNSMETLLQQIVEELRVMTICQEDAHKRKNNEQLSQNNVDIQLLTSKLIEVEKNFRPRGRQAELAMLDYQTLVGTD
ncbi:hypothetical protein NDU88_006403 [Pleurodeles waltl]|uniref:Uncharacterized protein n=1 Tax=Pleurodeles waltl TaxID=8319 RepID=A0AAV7TDT0_PLEWA|nr:hypothetical protein NDU88_006403 [Pleurodeles waltl]